MISSTTFYVIYDTVTGSPIAKGSCPAGSLPELAAHLPAGQSVGEVRQETILADNSAATVAAASLHAGNNIPLP